MDKYLKDNSSKRATEKAQAVYERPSNINFGRAHDLVIDGINPVLQVSQEDYSVTPKAIQGVKKKNMMLIGEIDRGIFNSRDPVRPSQLSPSKRAA